MIHQLRKKFIAITMVSVTVVMVLVGIAINVINFLSTNGNMENTLKMIYENQGTVPQFSNGMKGEADRRGDPFTMEPPYSTRYFVLRYTGEGVLLDADLRHIAAVTEEDAGTYLQIARSQGEGFGFTGSYKFYVVKNSADRYMAIFLDCHNDFLTLRNFAMISLGVFLGSILLIFILVVLFSRHAITPIIQNMEKQKRFITDASHEPKTPLTVINTSLKVLEMESGKSKWIDKIQGQTDKLTHLVNDLVTLSRLDEEKPPLQLHDFDSSAAVLEVVDSFRDYAAAQGHTITAEIPPGLVYHGDEYAVRQLTSILLDNAVKYTDPGGEIRVGLSREKRGIRIKTENPCTLPDEIDTEKLFDRFYRADPSRSQQMTGFGIGLSIVQSIVQAHNDSIRGRYSAAENHAIPRIFAGTSASLREHCERRPFYDLHTAYQQGPADCLRRPPRADGQERNSLYLSPLSPGRTDDGRNRRLCGSAA